MDKPCREGADRSENRRTVYVAWAILAAAITFAVIVRVRLLQIPLERDEGEFAYTGRLILQGFPPYNLAYNMKFPGVHAAYAGIMAVFGQTARGIHLGLLVTNVATIVMVFLLGRRLRDSVTGALAALCYAVMSVSPSVLGTSAHATHFVVLPALAGLLLLLPSQRPASACRLFAAGLLLGVAYLMKQPGAAFGLMGLLWVIWTEAKGRPSSFGRAALRICTFALGLLLPFAVTCFILLRAGVFGKFWFWTFDYASKYASKVTLSQGVAYLGIASPKVLLPFALVWCLAILGLAIGVLDKRLRPSAPFLWTFFASSVLAVCSTLLFREHYFVLALPAVCVAAAIAARGWRIPHVRLLPAVGISILLLGLIYPIWQQSDFLFRLSPRAACRSIYGLNPFPEAVDVANYIRQHSRPTDQIAILGSEAEILFCSNRRSATSYIFAYAFVEHQPYASRMQQEAIGQIERAKPKFLVWVMIPTSWCATVGSNPRILQWAPTYVQRNYDVAGVVDIALDNTATVWGPDADGYEGTPGQCLYVYQRRSPPQH